MLAKEFKSSAQEKEEASHLSIGKRHNETFTIKAESESEPEQSKKTEPVKQAQKAEVRTRSVFVGVKAAWKSLTRHPSTRSRIERSADQKRVTQLRDGFVPGQENSQNDVDDFESEQKNHDASAWPLRSEDFDSTDSKNF